ncbi:8247_t:CDS:2, partial [Racocetra fulgida]
NCQHRKILVPFPNLDNIPLLVYYDSDLDSSSNDELYFYLNFGTPKVETDNFNSDVDEKEKKENKSNIKYSYDEAGNTYIEYENAKPVLRGYITSASAIDSPISDLFNYYYEERQDPYQIGKDIPERVNSVRKRSDHKHGNSYILLKSVRSLTE